MAEQVMSGAPSLTGRPATPAWLVVAERELRELWLSGRGLVLMLAHTGVLSLTTYLVAVNQDLNFMEQREAVSLTLKVAIVVGGLLVLLVAADTLSGERERGTLESLLLTPAPRRALVLGKGVAAFSLWIVGFVLALPYVWWLGRDVGTFGAAVAGGLVVGTLLALLLAAIGILVSTFSASDLMSLSISLFVLVVLYAPTQMPSDAVRGWAGELLLGIAPFAGGLSYLDEIIIRGHSLGDDAGLLVVPLVLAALALGVAMWAAGRLRLLPGGRT